MNTKIQNITNYILIIIVLLSVQEVLANSNHGNFPPKEKEVEVYNIKPINSKGLDFCAIPYGDGIVFTSSRSQLEHSGISFFKKKYFDLFYSEKNDSGKYLNPRKLKGNINGELHDGTASFSKDMTTMYFTRNNEKRKGTVGLKIYSAEMVEGQWINVEELPFNSEKFSNCHPTISEDETKLYFASDRPGGFGGMDIYVSHLVNGDWSKPENLGINVNSKGNELFPYIEKNGDLFFSSDGKGGVGRLDIYLSEKDGKRFKRKSNLGEPFNTRSDDFGFYMDETREKGFLSSNRTGGTGNDDIYSWKLTDKAIEEGLICKFIVKDKKTGEVIEAAEVVIEQEYGDWKRTVLPNSGNGVYPYEVKNSDEYFLLIEKEGFESFNLVMDKKTLLEKEEHTVFLKRRSFSLLNGKVEGQVYHDALKGADVEILNECDGRKQFGKSRSDGSFGFTIMCGCEYIVIVKKEGFMTASKIISKDDNPCQNSKLIETKVQLRHAPNSSNPRASAFEH